MITVTPDSKTQPERCCDTCGAYLICPDSCPRVRLFRWVLAVPFAPGIESMMGHLKDLEDRGFLTPKESKDMSFRHLAGLFEHRDEEP